MARASLSVFVRACASAPASVRARIRELRCVAVNMFCMILQLNPGTDQPVWTLWVELFMKSADGPLGGTVTPPHSPATGLIIGVFVASSHSGCRQKEREFGP